MTLKVVAEKIQAPQRAKSFVAQDLYKKDAGDLLCICSSEEEALRIFNEIKFFAPQIKLLHLSAFDSLPYDRISPSNKILSERAQALCDMAISDGTFILVASIHAILNRLPEDKELLESKLELSVGKNISWNELINFLARNSFNRVDVATDVGDFAVRGEIIDFVLSSGEGVRINFEWDKVSQIRNFELDSQITSQKRDKITIYPASELKLTDSSIQIFREKFLGQFGAKAAESALYHNIMSKVKFSSSEYLLPLFYKFVTNIFSYLKYPRILIDDLVDASLNEYLEQIEDFYQARQDLKTADSEYYALPPEDLYLSLKELKQEFNNNKCFTIDSNDSSDITAIPNFHVESTVKQTPGIDLMIRYGQERKTKKIIICCFSKSSIDRISTILGTISVTSQIVESIAQATKAINLTLLALKSGFETKDYIFVSEQDLFGDKYAKPQASKKRLKNILLEAESLSEGELVVHKDHGIGRYLGVEILTVSGQPHDCLKILYSGEAKLYVPVENIDLIKRYGSDEGELDKLGGLGWQQRKARLKNRISELAAKLLKIAAERSTATINPVVTSTELYEEFAAKFPYPETDDQLNSINDIRSDLDSGRPMDRLICGDVGFGKTEVAMRAAFIVAASEADDNGKRKQVAVIAPTTILARQHYASFKQRFHGFNFRIKQLSRLVTSGEVRDIKKQLEQGEVDIIIGTHALLASGIKFDNLSLLIIDEEHHFGVKQKEKLKELKTGIHVLTLSATPIPRTLQMALFGLRDLSLIATPPIDRLSVRTSVLPYDSVIIRDALMREHFRGGRSFYVAPRIADLEKIELELKKIVPELTFKIAHGQMPPADIDAIMNDFYDGKFDILLSTTIIESGIDVPSANTIIIHKAEMLGLSQLYQLRGRVGRGKARGFAYLTLNAKKKLTKESLKRLEIMQTVDSLGAGFTIASHDMDMRGFGNLVGDEQSGHIKEVGIELYQDMLNQAIEVQSNNEDQTDTNKADKNFSPDINLGLSVFIPDDYISDASLRIGLYRRISDLVNQEDIDNFRYELIDRFGPVPQELENLLEILNIKFMSIMLNIEKLDVGPKGYTLKFRDDPKAADLVFKYIQQNPRNTKLKPDNKLIILKDTDPSKASLEVRNLLSQLQAIKL
jgi:transcription-repair coupling factor (superfamily II helicase)